MYIDLEISLELGKGRIMVVINTFPFSVILSIILLSVFLRNSSQSEYIVWLDNSLKDFADVDTAVLHIILLVRCSWSYDNKTKELITLTPNMHEIPFFEASYIFDIIIDKSPANKETILHRWVS